MIKWGASHNHRSWIWYSKKSWSNIASHLLSLFSRKYLFPAHRCHAALQAYLAIIYVHFKNKISLLMIQKFCFPSYYFLHLILLIWLLKHTVLGGVSNVVLSKPTYMISVLFFFCSFSAKEIWWKLERNRVTLCGEGGGRQGGAWVVEEWTIA